MNTLRNAVLCSLLSTFCLSVLATVAYSLEIKTTDGLTLAMDAQTGRIDAVRLDDQKLAQKAAGHPLRIRQFDASNARNLVPNPGFEEGDTDPRSWRMGTGNARVKREGSTATNRYCGRVATPPGASESAPATSGSLLGEAFPALPNRMYRWTAAGMAPPGGSGGSAYVKELDAQGRVIFENRMTVQHALSWRAGSSGEWLQREMTFVTKPNCAQLQVYVNIWKGHGDFFVDDMELVDCDALWREIVLSPSPVLAEQTPGTFSQRMQAKDEGLEVTLHYLAQKDHIRIETAISDVGKPARERSLQVEYVVPIELNGWTWHDDGRRSRRVTVDNVACDNAFPVAGGRISRYPFTSVSNGAIGLSLAAPMDQTRVQNFLADPSWGYRTVVDLGLSPYTRRIGAGRATFDTVLFRHDGQWGFRAAAQKYYSMFPQHFVKRAAREGTWFYAVSMSPVPHLEDFGAMFYEGYPRSSEERRSMRAHGMYIFPYTEPWGARQVFPEAKTRDEMPPLEERLRILRQWAEDRQSKAKLMGGPRWEIAQAILNTLPYDASGAPSGWKVDKYSHWAQWWMTNANPNLPEPNRALTCKRYEIDPVLQEADGLYLDSVSLWTANYFNYRRDHFAAADFPLVVDRRTGRPALLGMFSQTEFMAWLANDLHRQGKLLHMNIFPDAYRFCAHLADVLGCEVGTFGHRSQKKKPPETEDADDLLRRTFAYHKPTTNLLQEGNYLEPVPELSHAQVVDYLKQQLFYGFYPGIATIGGEDKPGYVGWKRYFGTPSQYERDRAEFKKVIGALNHLAAAGWEPIPWARTSNDRVWLERFGSWETNTLHYTLRNPGDQPEQVTVTVQPSNSTADRGGLAAAEIRDLLAQSAVPTTAGKTPGCLEFTLTLPARDTAVVRLQRAAPSARP